MIDEIEAIEPVSNKKRIPDWSVCVPPISTFSGSVLPHHFESLILKANIEVFKTSSDNNYRNRAEMRKWRIQDEKNDVWRWVAEGKKHNSFLNRRVEHIPRLVI